MPAMIAILVAMLIVFDTVAGDEGSAGEGWVEQWDRIEAGWWLAVGVLVRSGWGA